LIPFLNEQRNHPSRTSLAAEPCGKLDAVGTPRCAGARRDYAPHNSRDGSRPNHFIRMVPNREDSARTFTTGCD
jgi:hypothetical protein